MVNNINYLNLLIMEATLFIFLISMLMGICGAQTSTLESDELSMNSTHAPVDVSLLEFY